MNKISCSECGNKDDLNFMQDTETGELICRKCGLVVSQDLSFAAQPSPTFNRKTQQPETTSHGAYMTGLIHDYGMSTMVGQFLDLARLRPEERKRFYNLRKWQRRTRGVDSRDRNLQIALGYLQSMTHELAIPRNVSEEAARIYRLALNVKLIRGRTISHMAAAALYFACRINEITRTLKDIASTKILEPESNTAKESGLIVARNYRLMLKYLNLKPPVQSPLPFITQICSKLGLPLTVERDAAEMLTGYIATGKNQGKNNSGLAAAAIYIATKRLDVKGFPQSMIAKAAQVTEVTIRNLYKAIVEKMKINMAPESGPKNQ